MGNQPAKSLSTEQQKTLILNMTMDDEQEPDQFFEYLEHIGFDMAAIRDAKELPAAVLGHYRISKGKYDISRAANDLATFGPIASRIVELQQQQNSLAN